MNEDKNFKFMKCNCIVMYRSSIVHLLFNMVQIIQNSVTEKLETD